MKDQVTDVLVNLSQVNGSFLLLTQIDPSMDK